MPDVRDRLVYMCNCAELCHSAVRTLSRRRWYAHARHRPANSIYNTPYLQTDDGLVSHRLARRQPRRPVALRSPAPAGTGTTPGEGGMGQDAEQQELDEEMDLDEQDEPPRSERNIPSPPSSRPPSPSPSGSEHDETEEDDRLRRAATPPPIPELSRADDAMPQPPLLPPMNESIIDEFRMSQRYIECLQNASLTNGDLSDEDLDRLLHPPTCSPELHEERDRDVLLSLRLFLANTTGSQDNYTKSVAAIHRAGLGVELLSHHNVSRKVGELTGVSPIVNDMCIDSCAAFTAFNKDLEACPVCHKPRYHPTVVRNQKRKPVQTYQIYPVGPQIQALHRHSVSAEELSYFEEQSRKILSELEGAEDLLASIGDVTTGADIRDAVKDGRIEPEDTVLIASLDGAQLYRNKVSDCWILIYIVVNYSPDRRYKKRYVLPGGVIPGPKKPVNMESFLYPSFHHISAINRAGGLPIWDAHRAAQGDPAKPALYRSMLFFLFATADGPGMVCMSGLVGHSGRYGCRLWCGLPGRRVPGQRGGHYYPALAKPHNYNVEGCDHGDEPYHTVRPPDPGRYAIAVRCVSAARGRTNYQDLRLETGVVRPSILLGLFLRPERPMILGMPNMCPGDNMHLLNNLALHLLKLWRGKYDCIAPDVRGSWHWAVLTGETWQEHGKAVAACARYLPGPFGRVPRNPAEKINSGYKTWELVQYMYELGPGLFYRVLPDDIWEHFCKVVGSIRLLSQYEATSLELARSYTLSTDFVEDYESIYYQRRPERIHFVTQVIHNVLHMPHEAVRLGLGGYYSQWTLERTIGNLTEEIKQHQDPYRNLSFRALRRAQTSTLVAMFPQLDDAKPNDGRPATAEPLGGGYFLLRKRDKHPRTMRGSQKDAIQDYLVLNDAPTLKEPVKIRRYGRLLLPNGQVARSSWVENGMRRENIRQAYNVKLESEGTLFFAAVTYFFHLRVQRESRTVAMVSLYGDPDQELLRRSSYTLWSCERPDEDAYVVIDIDCIRSVVGMVPFAAFFHGEEYANRVYVAEKVGLSVAHMGGYVDLEEIQREEGDETTE